MTYARVGRWLFLSWFVPLIGGVIGYWKFRNDDSRLAKLLLAGTFAFPVADITAFVLISNGVDIALALLAAIVAPVFVGAALYYLLRENPYSKLLFASYMYLPGVVYLYYGPFKEQPRLRRAAKNFGLYAGGATVLTVLLVMLAVL